MRLDESHHPSAPGASGPRATAASAWAGLRDGRWGVPAVAVVAVLVVVAAVAVALVLRAGTTLPSTDFTAAAEPSAGSSAGTGAASGVAESSAGGGAAGDSGAAGARGLPGASASATSGPGGGAAGGDAVGGVGAAGGTVAPAGGGVGAAPGSGAGSAVDQAPVVVHVVGQVLRPGLVRVPAGSRVADAVEAAGGLTAEADGAAINLARAVLDGEQLVVPRPGEVPVGAPVTGPPGAPGASPAAPGSGASAGAAPGGLISLSTATPAELDTLPGIGPVLAQRIVDFRGANGGFTSVDDLAEVTGIGDAVLADVRPLVTV